MKASKTSPNRPLAGMDALAAEVSRKGSARVERECRKMIRGAWQYRHTSYSAPIVIRSNVRFLRDVALLSQ